MDKYGNAAAEEVLPKELLLGQSEKEVEYDRAGRVIKGQVRSKSTVVSIFSRDDSILSLLCVYLKACNH